MAPLRFVIQADPRAISSVTRLIAVRRGEGEYKPKPTRELPPNAVQMTITADKYEFADGVFLHLGASEDFNTVVLVE